MIFLASDPGPGGPWRRRLLSTWPVPLLFLAFLPARAGREPPPQRGPSLPAVVDREVWLSEGSARWAWALRWAAREGFLRKGGSAQLAVTVNLLSSRGEAPGAVGRLALALAVAVGAGEVWLGGVAAVLGLLPVVHAVGQGAPLEPVWPRTTSLPRQTPGSSGLAGGLHSCAPTSVQAVLKVCGARCGDPAG